ncbi:hypothetical protein WJX72_004193 [[Myrmecia] bisecta]|uniref:Protein kinase domain-containing protein n=1 Tax=[Myrmecia] bisecta TaxID=41462 RepID=A0AAW1PFP0_9CHLO
MGCAGSKNPFGGVLVSLTTKQEVQSVSHRQQITAAPTPDVPICIPPLQEGWGAYQGAPRLSTDAERVEELSKLSVHPTQAEPRFDRITKVSLNPEVLVLEDMMQDARSRESPWVLAAPRMRFYAGVPLETPGGARLGTLHIADFKPRKFGASACTILCNFAEMAARELCLPSAAPASTTPPVMEALTRAQQQRAQLVGANHRLHPIVPCVAVGVVLVDVAQPKWPILFCDSLWAHHTGVGVDALIGKPFWEAYSIPGMSSKAAAPWDAFARAIQAREMFCVGLVDVTRAEHVERRFGVTFKPASRDNVDAVTRQIRISHHKIGAADTHDQDLDRCAFENVELGPILGRGSFGCVYMGYWNGAACAVKVMEHKLSDQGIKEADASLEGMLGLNLSHPNIVCTFKYMVTPRAIPVWKRLRSPDRELWAAQAAEVARSQLPGDDSTPSTTQGDLSPPMKTARLWQGTGALTRAQWCIETWLVMELCGLGDLQEHIDQGVFRDQRSSYAGGVNMLWIVLTAAEIAGAMAYIHSQDILHGDLSGGNILLVGNSGADDRPFAAKVADFGLSRILAGDDTVETGSFGTVTHMPPELLREGRLSKAADAYAYGVILWSMYTGQRPWAGMRHAQILAQKFLGNACLPFPDHTPRAYRELAERCMDPDDAARPSFADVVAALKPVHAAVRSGNLTNADFDFPVYPAYKDEGRPALIVKLEQEAAAKARAGNAHKASKARIARNPRAVEE